MPCMKDNKIRPNNYESAMQSKLRLMKEQIRANNREGDLKSKIVRVKNTDTLKENIKSVLEFDRECEQNGLKIGSRYSALTTLHCLCQFARRKPFKKFMKADIMAFLNASKHRKFEDNRYRVKTQNVEKQLANSTMNLVKLRVKRFFQWLYNMEKGQYPESVRWIKLAAIRGDRQLTSQNLPTPKEVKRMIECTENPRDRALISLLAESGARAGEISTIQLKDINWNDKGFVLTLRGKTGQRQIPICACMANIKNWINNFHPFKSNAHAPLFTSFVYSRTWKTNLKVDGIASIVRKASEKAGVEKRIHMHPHKFRHLRASQLAEAGWNEPMLRQYFGWTKSSSMPSTYIHLTEKAMTNRYYEMYGKVDPHEQQVHTLEEPEICNECGVQNPTGYRFCFHCNAALDKEQQKLIENHKHVRNALNLIAKDADLASKFSLLINEVFEKQRYKHAS